LETSIGWDVSKIYQQRMCTLVEGLRGFRIYYAFITTKEPLEDPDPIVWIADIDDQPIRDC
jgi:hypothetical protein